MKKRFFTLILSLGLITVTAIPLVACSDKDSIPEYSYGEKYLKFVEIGGDREIYGKQASCTESEKADYLFDITLSDKDKNKCVYYTEQILSNINADKLTVNVFDNSTYASTYLEDNSLYTHMQEFKTVDYATTVLLANFGEYCNYGLAYGYANYIAKELGWEYSTQNELPTTSNKYLYDMNLLCFSEQYVNNNDTSFCKKLGIYFVNNYIENNGVEEFEKLLVSSGDNEQLDSFNTTLSNWYLQNGIEYTPSTIIYRLGGELYEFIANNDYCIFHIRKDWVDMTTERYTVIDKKFMHENYSVVKEYFESITESMTKLRTLFDLDNYFDPVRVYYKNSSNGTWFGTSSRTITIDAMAPLLHEYIHSLTFPYVKSEQLWAVEGLPHYFSYYYEHPLAMEYFNYDKNNCNRQSNTEILFVYRERIGRDIDLKKDVRTINDIVTYYFSHTSPNQSYEAAASFLHYIVTNYGERTAINYYLSHNGTFAELDKSFEELVADWQEYINTTYSDYPKYKK